MLPFFLHESAKRSALRSLAAVGTSDYPEAGFHAAQAVEHLAKALLCDLNSVFLTSRDHMQSNAFLSGKGHPDTKTLADIRTSHFADAVRLAYEKKECGYPKPLDLDLVKLARDAAAHIGYGDADPSIAAVAAMVRLLEPLLGTQGQAVEQWLDDPRIVALRDVIRDLPRQDVRRSPLFRKSSVFARIWNAQRESQRLRQRMSEEQWLMLASQPKDLSDDGETEAGGLRNCPAGEREHLTWFKAEWEQSDTQDHDQGEGYADWDLRLAGVDCSTCGLSLDYHDVQLLGLGEVINSETREID